MPNPNVLETNDYQYTGYCRLHHAAIRDNGFQLPSCVVPSAFDLSPFIRESTMTLCGTLAPGESERLIHHRSVPGDSRNITKTPFEQCANMAAPKLF
jgi:hypothetical protein